MRGSRSSIAIAWFAAWVVLRIILFIPFVNLLLFILAPVVWLDSSSWRSSR